MEICKFLQYNGVMSEQPRLRADRLKEEVDKLSIKPGKLAEELGISYETLYKTLRGEIAQPPAETIAKLAIRTGCSIEYFMDLTEKKAPTNLDLSDMQQSLIKLAQTLPLMRQHDLLLIAQTYAQAGTESTKFFFQDLKNMLIRVADDMGRGEELGQVLEWLAEMERKSLFPASSTIGVIGTTEEPSDDSA
jgi:transcriptional regulator with XRE-family HTH domain